GRDNANQSYLAQAQDALSRFNSNYGKDAQHASDATELYSQIRSAQAKLGNADAATDIAKRADALRQPGSCSGLRADEEMRQAALDGLLSMNSEDAIPILESVLKQRDPCKAELRKKAVFQIAQKHGPSVVPTLLDVAKNDPSTDVRADAIFW